MAGSKGYTAALRKKREAGVGVTNADQFIADMESNARALPRTMYRAATGIPENLLSMATGMGSMVAGGLAGGSKIATDWANQKQPNLDEFTDTVDRTMQAGTYQPRLPESQELQGALGSALRGAGESFDKTQAGKGWYDFSAKHPALAAGVMGFTNAGNPEVAGGKVAAKSAVATALRRAANTAKAALPEAPRGLPAALSEAGHASMEVPRNVSTVMRPKRVAYPGVYTNPRELVARAKVDPEDPLMKRLFGVTREELFDISEQGARKGNIIESPYKTAANPKGAPAGEDVTNPRNTQRLVDIITEAKQRPDLYKGMAAWYTMDPLYQQLVRLVGPEQAKIEFNRLNTLTGMASPGSEVLTELNRGTAMNYLDKLGRAGDFEKYGGVPEHQRGADYPVDMRGVQGHAYHKTAQTPAMLNYLRHGKVDMKSAKVPSYIAASGVPETGFQTQFPVADAHFSRIVGLPDTRAWKWDKKAEGFGPNTASASVPEVVSMTPWFQQKIAAAHGIEPVPAQAVTWGAGSHATGVTSPIGAPKLELTARQIGAAARRLGIEPEQARDMMLLGKAYAGKITPEMAALLAAGGGAAATVAALRAKNKDNERNTK